MVGFGFTERPSGIKYDMDTWVGQAVGLLDALGLEKAHVVGNSFGGAIALALAIRHPERVERLVLMGSVGVPFPISTASTPSGATSRRSKICASCWTFSPIAASW